MIMSNGPEDDWGGLIEFLDTLERIGDWIIRIIFLVGLLYVLRLIITLI